MTDLPETQQEFLSDKDAHTEARLLSAVRALEREGVCSLTIGHALLGVMFQVMSDGAREDPDFLYYVRDSFVQLADDVEERVEAAMRNYRAGGDGTYKH